MSLTSKNSFLISILFLGFNMSSPLKAQDLNERFNALEKIRIDQKRFLPPYLMDSLVGLYQDGLAGSQVKEGKALKTSLSVEEKGATFNIGFNEFQVGRFDIYSAIQVAGSGDNKFVSVLEKNKYQQTLSAGGVFNIFYSRAGGSFYKRDRILSYKRLDEVEKIYSNSITTPAVAPDSWNIAGQVAYLTQAEIDLNAYITAYDALYPSNWDAMQASYLAIQDKGTKAMDTLKALGLLDKSFDEDDFFTTGKLPVSINAITGNPNLHNELARKRYVGTSEKIFMEAPWTRFNLSWFTVGVNYNVSPQSMIDTMLKDDNYLGSYNNEYVKLLLGWNYSSIHNWGRQFQLTLSPTVSFTTSRNFQESNKITVSKTVPYTSITGDTLAKTLFTSVGYEKAADRLFTWSFEMPFIFLWNKDNIGIDLALRAGGNDPKGDNVGGRLGIYIPIDIKESTPVWIEPIIRVGKLFEKSDMNFWEDNVTVGFNLSIALKKFSILPKAN